MLRAAVCRNGCACGGWFWPVCRVLFFEAAPSSVLRFRNTYGDAAECVRQRDLAAETTVRCRLDHAIEHACLDIRARLQPVEPAILDITVTGGAGTGAAAFGFDARDLVVAGGLHDGGAGGDIDNTSSAVELNECDHRHGGYPVID